MSSTVRTPKRTHLDDDAFARRGQRRRPARRQSTRRAAVAAAIREG